jgi:hypothetical protein
MRMSWKAVIAIGLLVLAIVFYPKLAEAFQGALPTPKNLDDICKERSSCSTCLVPVEGDVRGSCGWCEGAQRCVARAGTRPVVPKITDAAQVRRVLEEKNATLRAAGQPEIRITGNEVLDAFQCPATDFVTSRYNCKDFNCSQITNCSECADINKCGWCAAEGKCISRTLAGEPNIAAGDTCQRDKFTTAAVNCPGRPCETISDCKECTRSMGCGYCSSIKRCINVNLPQTDPKFINCPKESQTLYPSQCDEVKSITGVVSEKSDVKPSAGQLAAAQTNELSGAGGSGQATPGLVAPTKPRPKAPAAAQGTMMSDPGTVTAPGQARPLGSTSERDTYPDATGTDVGALQGYIDMLVRSQLAALGVPTNEPFQIGDVMANAGGFMEQAKRKIFG